MVNATAKHYSVESQVRESVKRVLVYLVHQI